MQRQAGVRGAPLPANSSRIEASPFYSSQPAGPMDSSYSKTLTFVVSGAMVMGSLQAAVQHSAQLGDSSSFVVCAGRAES